MFNAEQDVIGVAQQICHDHLRSQGIPEAFSLSVTVDGGQNEVYRSRDALIVDGGEPNQCGWLEDPAAKG